MTLIKGPTVPCPDCGGTEFAVGEARNARGDVIYPYFCRSCEYVFTQYAPKKAALALGELPRVYTKTERKIAAGTHTPSQSYMEPCEVCGATGDSELHHWAPYHLFGYECEKWPQSYLCRACHVRWHQTVTPNMGKRDAGGQ